MFFWQTHHWLCYCGVCRLDCEGCIRCKNTHDIIVEAYQQIQETAVSVDFLSSYCILYITK